MSIWEGLSVSERFTLEAIALEPRLFLPLAAGHALKAKGLIRQTPAGYTPSLLGRWVMAERHKLPFVIGQRHMASLERTGLDERHGTQ